MRVVAEIKIKGLVPILFNSFPLDTLDAGVSKSGSGAKNEEEWKRSVLITKDRELYILSSWLVSSVVAGGKYIKEGRSNISKKVGSSLCCLKESLLLDGLMLPPENELTTSRTDTVYIDVRSVVNPMTKGRNVRYRIAAGAGWTLTTSLSWDDFTVSKERLKECVKNAGAFEGVGDGRKIGFGRFDLLSFLMVS